MLTQIKHAFRRSPSAFLLNLLGLSVAFASFLIIMMQVDYDYNFNRCVPHHERIYQVYRGEEHYFNVRVAAGADHFAMPRRLEECVRKVAGDVEVEFHFLDQTFDQTYRDELRFIHQMQLFSLLAILISIIGVFGLTMYESEYRRKEIGLRKIMGSTTQEVLLMFNRRYLLMLFASFVVAAPIGWSLGTRWLQGFAERIAIPWWLFLLSLLLVAIVTILTVTYRTWKNASENPIHCIKAE